MATYTMQLREIIERAVESERDYYTSSNNDIIEKGRKQLFNFDYPIFDENYRKVFEKHFIRTFYMREIGFETEGLFKFQLETWLQVNMPYFNKLFESERITYNPLANTIMQRKRNTGKDTERTDKRKTDDETESTTETEGDEKTTNESKETTKDDSETKADNFNRTLDQNTPDSRLEISTENGEGTIEYASNIQESMDDNKQQTKSDSTTEQEGTSNRDENETIDYESSSKGTDDLDSKINETSDYLENEIGKIGEISYPELIQKHRDAFLRVEGEIFREMNQLFMLVY